MFEIVHTCSETDRNKDFIGIGVDIDERTSMPYHSTLVICFKSEIHVFHFNGIDVRYDKEFDNYSFHIKLGIIESKLVPSFIAMCRRIKKTANPTFGYFYSGEYYDKDGTHFSENNLGQNMTCVGFSLNVLKGFFEEDYLIYSDWDGSSHKEDGYLENYCRRRGLEISKIAEFHRRITPLELLCSGYYTSLPISKKQVETKQPEAIYYLLNYN